MLTLYRRHLSDCPHRAKGRAYTLCPCPIWTSGTLHGKEVRQTLSTTDIPEAARRMAALAGAPAPVAGVAAPEADITVARAVEMFLDDCKDRVKDSTYRSYDTSLAALVKFAAGAKLASINVLALDAYKKARAVSSGTWGKELVVMRSLFKWCLDRDLCAANPARKLRLPPTKTLVTPPLEDDEVAALIAACGEISSINAEDTQYIRRRALALVYTLLYSGLRISDVAQLQRFSLNPLTRHLTIGKIVKTGVPLKVLLNEKAVAALQALPVQGGNPKYFFWSGNGKPDSCIGSLRGTVYTLGRIAGIKVAPHRFRDTFAVALLTGGADIRTVQKLLGHKTVKTTERHYAHFVAAHQALLDTAASALNFAERGHGGPLLVQSLGNRRRNA